MSTQPQQLKIATYNVWFGSVSQKERSTTILRLIDSLDIVCFQEVTNTFIITLLTDSTITSTFHICRNGFDPSFCWYGVITLVRKSKLNVIGQENVKYPHTNQGRTLLVVDVEGTDASIPKIRISQSHFESMSSETLRAQQRRIASELTTVTDTTQHRFGIICGDTNAHHPSEVKDAFEQVGFTDIWTQLKGPDDFGATFGLTFQKGVEPQSRIDRIGWHGSALKAVDVYRIGEKELEGMPGIYPSDHLGLVGVFEVVPS
ncbi:hypothetical protein HDU97_000486 [Phlyctochytrium planicorne]|nr:hypothetical protein HDU97_000486 [Phlyctochytrium planicorne]